MENVGEALSLEGGYTGVDVNIKRGKAVFHFFEDGVNGFMFSFIGASKNECF